MSHRHVATAALAIVAVVAAGAASGMSGATATPSLTRTQSLDHLAASLSQRTHPSPSHFTQGRVDNPWFPLRPGNKLISRGIKDGQHSRDVFFITYKTRVIDGVTCRVVHDRLYLHGMLHERTTDWYAQTKRGTIWYFGEATAELDRQGRVVSREGSFKSGTDGAEAGIFMPAHPRVGQSFKQEDYPGHAEDHFEVLDRTAHVSVPVIASDQALLTREWTPLEPGVVDHKFYVRDIGQVREVAVRGGDEVGNLVAILHISR